ncbi:MAG: Serine protease AprX [Anaerolineales bacterium]|nr:Serine protease AprX [Anaerolineales bacterium]
MEPSRAIGLLRGLELREYRDTRSEDGRWEQLSDAPLMQCMLQCMLQSMLQSVLKQASYAILGIAVAVILLVTPPAAVGQQPAGPRIQLQAASFDPLQSRPAAPGVTPTIPESNPGVYLMQFRGPVKPAWKAEVTAAGAELFDYIPDYAFVARMDAAAAKQVAALPTVRWVGAYQPGYRISPALHRKPGEADAADRSVEVRISTFPGAARETETALAALGGQVIRSTESVFGGTLRVMVPRDAIARLARSPAVRWIEPALRYRLLNDVARRQEIMNVERVWGLGLFGAGQIVAYSDSGLDVGNLETLSADFEGRVLTAHPLGEGGTWNDPVGHGTHVAGSIAGSGALSGSDPAAHAYDGSLAGVAPEAFLVVQAFGTDEVSGEIEGLPEDFNVLFQQAYDDGARIHSNSWGAIEEGNSDDPFGGYTLDAQQADEFAWSHRDMTILFAAGNSGKDALPENEFLPGDGIVDPDSLNVPGTAKNVISVGASESHRPPGDNATRSRNMNWFWLGPSNFLHPPIAGDYVSDNIDGMAAFSSRGPTDDGRIKPDIVAPGTNIVSARSHDPAFEPFLGSWGGYEENDNYVYNGGTSMATPLTAGAVALVRQWYVEKQGLSNPSSALIKATLINGAADMAPGQYGTGDTREIPPRPNAVEGWGRVNLHRSLVGAPPRLIWFDDHTTGLQTGDRIPYGPESYELDVVNFAIPLQVALVWTDYPGSPAAGKQLVNDLDLTVVAPDGREWQGNGVTRDRTNNLESVEIAQPVRGHYRIVVEAHNVPHGPQPYALVVAGGLTREGVSEAFVPIISR